MEDDFDIDDILSYGKSKKKIDSSSKGKRGEGLLIKELEKRFPGKPFSRTLGSGNRISQVKLTEEAKRVFASDIVTTSNCRFVFECKKGYNNIDLERAIRRLSEGKIGNSTLNKFLKQVTNDGENVNKQPLLCWKKDYQPWLAFLRTEHLPAVLVSDRSTYGEWSIVPLIKLLEQPDEFFFD